MKNTYATLYIMRHGQSEANVADVRGGDTPLTDTGKQQVHHAAKRLQQIHFDAIFSSPLIRTQQTAAIFAQEHKLAVITKEALRERFSGEMEGKHYKEIKKAIEQYNQTRKEKPYEETKHISPVKNFESDEQIMSRFITSLREIAVAYPGKKILITSHWGLMRTFLVHVGYLSFKELHKLKFENTAHIVVKTDGIDFFIEDVVGLVKNERYGSIKT